ncbi:MAG TPA: UDP-N-acetylmuramoyl-L-alanine--D-glutamate ligase, partial [Stellaceae bacterium]|nr:UDP-N-acetylmuramoyl-L-alanine--D-glutamate ligase [Stellaceae bacterium]
MIEVATFQGEKVAVMGLARSGLVAAQALQQGGATVMAWDDVAAKRDAAAAAGVPIVDLGTADFAGVKVLVLSPGIPHTYPKPNPVAARARAAGAQIIGDIELLARSRPKARYIGITGTNGKSTTTALIGHIVAQAGRRVAIGGNLGTPALALAPLGADGVYVLEMSSYQLELTESLAFDVAVLLNITPDHLDRHGGMDGYIAAKRRIFSRQKNPQTAILGVDDAPSRRMAETLARLGEQRVVPISAEGCAPGGVYVENGWLIDDMAGTAKRVLELRRAARLPGAHNWQNAAAAYAATRALGIDTAVVIDGINGFAGLAHRQELVATIDGIAYVNDSKATNADATAKALACYDAIYWIAGGVPKEGGIASLAPFFPRIRHAFLIGKATEEFAATLDGHVPMSRCSELGRALAAARETALAQRKPGAVVLLSPACASFDQFSNFEERGDVFRRLVQALPGAR